MELLYQIEVDVLFPIRMYNKKVNIRLFHQTNLTILIAEDVVIVLDSRIHIWNGSMTNVTDSDHFKIDLIGNEDSINNKNLLLFKFRPGTQRQMREQLLKALEKSGRKIQRSISQPPTVDNLVDIPQGRQNKLKKQKSFEEDNTERIYIVPDIDFDQQIITKKTSLTSEENKKTEENSEPLQDIYTSKIRKLKL